MRETIVIDKNTGEYIREDKIYSWEEVSTQKKNDEIRKSKEEFKVTIDNECGSFYFTNYKKILEEKFMPNYMFRFLYLCTYSDYEGILRLGKSKNNYMIKSDIIHVLKISDKENRNTVKYLEENKLIEIHNDYIKVNDSLCVRGKIGKKLAKQSVRMFDNGIKYIYENITAREHKRAYMVVELLPYLHYSSNILVKNPEVEDEKLIKPFNMKELSEELGYTNTDRFSKALLSMRINKELAIGRFGESKNIIVINPRLYYKGGNDEEIKGVLKLFVVESRL